MSSIAVETFCNISYLHVLSQEHFQSTHMYHMYLVFILIVKLFKTYPNSRVSDQISTSDQRVYGGLKIRQQRNTLQVKNEHDIDYLNLVIH